MNICVAVDIVVNGIIQIEAELCRTETGPLEIMYLIGKLCTQGT